MTLHSARTDEDLLVAARHDSDAFGAFYERHEHAVAINFMRRARDPEIAADLTAETFATALVKVRRYKPTGAAVGWLFGIARNLWLRSLRASRVEDHARRKLGVQLELDDAMLRRFDRLAGEAEAARLLDDVPAEQADAIRARVINDEPYDAIAARLQCSQSVVRQRVSRGLATLRTREEKP